MMDGRGRSIKADHCPHEITAISVLGSSSPIPRGGDLVDLVPIKNYKLPEPPFHSDRPCRSSPISSSLLSDKSNEIWKAELWMSPDQHVQRDQRSHSIPTAQQSTRWEILFPCPSIFSKLTVYRISISYYACYTTTDLFRKLWII